MKQKTKTEHNLMYKIKHRNSDLQLLSFTVQACLCACTQTNLVWQHRLQATTEVAENVAVLVDLHTLAVILYL